MYFSWDGILSMTNVELDLVSDVDMYLLLENGMGQTINI